MDNLAEEFAHVQRGHVVSSLGKGIASAALGALLQARGFKVRFGQSTDGMRLIGDRLMAGHQSLELAI